MPRQKVSRKTGAAPARQAGTGAGSDRIRRAPPSPGEPVYFDGPGTFRSWLAAHGGAAAELLVGFHKRATGKASLTWPESVDEALCFGWIDGVRRSVDAGRYTIRFTPRRLRSTWSAVNIARVKELEREGRLRPAGREAFRARADARSAIYAYEQRRSSSLSAVQEQRFRAEAAAWSFFGSQAPWYRRTAIYWVVSAKREETREKRFQELLRCSAREERIPPLRRTEGRGG